MDNKIVDRLDLEEFTNVTNMVAKHYNISEEEAEEYVMSFGPKKLKRMGVLEADKGWRDGYTKQTIEKRKETRRKKNKMARKARRANR